MKQTAIWTAILFSLSCLLAMGSLNASGQSPEAPPPAALTAELPLRSPIAVTVESEPEAASLDRSKGQQWRRANMQLAGSMCIACLMQVEEKLRELPGIAYAKIARPTAPSGISDSRGAAEPAPEQKAPQGTAEAKPRTAALVVIYDSGAVKFEKLTLWLKQQKYKAVDVQDVPVTAG